MHKFFTAATKPSALTARPASGYPLVGLLNVPVGVSRWLTRTACAAHLCQCGFGFAIRTVRASHRLAPTPLRDENLCIIPARDTGDSNQQKTRGKMRCGLDGLLLRVACDSHHPSASENVRLVSVFSSDNEVDFGQRPTSRLPRQATHVHPSAPSIETAFNHRQEAEPAICHIP